MKRPYIFLSPINRDNLAGKWPLFGCRHQPSPDWIPPDVFPFLRVTFIAPQEMIEKSALPNRCGGWNRPTKLLFQQSRPLFNPLLFRQCNEQMQMIRHDDIPAHRNSLRCIPLPSKPHERSLDGWGRQ